MIYPCTCKHTYQDQQYGPGNRVHNLSKTGGQARCTVCGSTKTVTQSNLINKDNKQ